MNLEEIKKGTHVFIPGVVDREPEGEYLYVTYKCGSNRNGLEYFRRADAAKLLIFHPTNGIKNSEPAPKYAPCRLFRKGDKVRVVERDGRDYKDYDPYTNIQKSELYTILENENEVIDGGCVGIRIGKGDIEYEIPFYFLELVTPVEELEPYVICENDASYEVRLHSKKENHTMAIYNKNAYGDWLKARYAAEAERDRLNAEHRKEQK